MDSEIIKDERPITAMFYNDSVESQWKVTDNIKIRAYGEPGLHCFIPFYAVEENGVVIARVPATMVEVSYK